MPTKLLTDDLTGKIIQVIAKTQRIPPETISIDSTFEELKIDSLDGINIIFALENEFQITIPDEGVQNLRTIRQMVDGVLVLIAEQEKGAPPGAA